MPELDIKSIPDCEFERACRILNSRIRFLMKDPAIKAEFEEWEKEYEARKKGEVIK